MVEIKHPRTGEYIEGKRLQVGDVIRPGDRYNADNGWETMPSLVNRKIDENCTSIWVRKA